jgi:hypothetical protein
LRVLTLDRVMKLTSTPSSSTRFSQVCNPIPRISNASVVVAFRQGVRDEKMLEKIVTHDIQNVVELFSLADKCARAVPGTPHLPRRQVRITSPMREGKQKMYPEEERDEEMAFQNAKREMKAVYGHSDFESSDNERRKALHVMFGGSWDIMSRCIVKTLRREVAVTAPAPKAALHRKWMETSISFDASDCPKNMVRAGQLPLIVSRTITNIMLYHVLIDGGAALNLINLAAFKKLHISMSKLQPLLPFSGVGPVSVMLHGCISLPVTFRTPENFHTESVLFDVAEVNLPFNVILAGQPCTSLWRSPTTGTWS